MGITPSNLLCRTMPVEKIVFIATDNNKHPWMVFDPTICLGHKGHRPTNIQGNIIGPLFLLDQSLQRHFLFWSCRYFCHRTAYMRSIIKSDKRGGLTHRIEQLYIVCYMHINNKQHTINLISFNPSKKFRRRKTKLTYDGDGDENCGHNGSHAG